MRWLIKFTLACMALTVTANANAGPREVCDKLTAELEAADNIVDIRQLWSDQREACHIAWMMELESGEREMDQEIFLELLEMMQEDN